MNSRNESQARALALATMILALAPALAPAQARLKQVAERQTFVATAGESSQYIAARGFPGPDRPLVFTGNYEDAVNFPVAGGITWSGILTATSGVPSIFLGIVREPTTGVGWNSGNSSANFDRLEPRAWFNFPTAEPSADVRDMAAPTATRAYLTGVVTQATTLQKIDNTSIFIAPPNQIAIGRGFLAAATNGKFDVVALTDIDMRPHAIAAESLTDRLVVFGQQRDAGESDFEKMDALLQRYTLPISSTPSAEITWDAEPKLENMDARDVAVTSDDVTWVAGSLAGNVIEGTPPTGTPLGGSTDLWVGQADFAGTQIVNDFLLGSEGFDEWGSMEAGPHGEIYVAFKVGGSQVSFGNLSLTLPSFPISHSCLGMIKSDGTPAWVVPLARGRELQSAMFATDIDVDPAGNVYVGITANGDFDVRNTRYSMSGTGQIVVDGTGRVISFTPTPNVGAVKASVAFDIENRFVLGRTAPPFLPGKASFSSIESAGIAQESYTVTWIITSSNDNTVNGLDRIVTELGGQVYLTTNFHFPPAFPIKTVSVYLTPGQVATLGGVPGVSFKVDPLTVTPDGTPADPIDFETASNAGWALARLLDPFTLASGPEAQFVFPAGFVTSASAAKKVRVYVIDKGLAPGQVFAFPDLDQPDALPISFDGDKGLCVDALAHQTDNGDLDPDTASDHPKQAVNLIGVSGIGSAQGTAMEFISVDMYTGASTDTGNCLTYMSYVSHAILQAVADASERNLFSGATGFPPLPNLIMIASSGPTPVTELDLTGAVQQALANNIPIILSAGNDGAAVQDYRPAGLGDLEGVITVGGLAEGGAGNHNPFYANSNTDSAGDIISLYAPGEGVPTGFGSSSGTSYSCALVAGIAATYLALHPDATPAQVEQALVRFSYRDEERGINIAQSTCSFASWLLQNGLGQFLNDPDAGMASDTDGDGLNALSELLGGSDPNDPLDARPHAGTFTLTPGGANVSTLVPRSLLGLDGSLGDACLTIPFSIESSSNLQSWQPMDPASGLLRAGQIIGARRQLVFELDSTNLPPARAFFRFAFGPSPAP